MRQPCDGVGSLVRRWRNLAASATACHADPGVEDPLRFVTNDTVIAGSVGGEVRRLGEAAVDEVESWVRTGTFRTPVHPETLAITA